MANFDGWVADTAEIARNWRIPHKETRECLIIYKQAWVKRQKRRDQKIQEERKAKQQARGE